MGALALTQGDADAPLGELLDHLTAPPHFRGQGHYLDTVQGAIGGKQVLEGTSLKGAEAVLRVGALLLLADEWPFQVGSCPNRNKEK